MPDDTKAAAPEGAARPTTEAGGGVVPESISDACWIRAFDEYPSYDEENDCYLYSDGRVKPAKPVCWPMSGPDWRQPRRERREIERQRTLALAACDGDIGPALDAVYEQVERDHDEQKR